MSHFSPNSAYGPDLWPLFVTASAAGVADDLQCATVCLLLGIDSGEPCHLFYLDGTTCYTGAFTSQPPGGVLAAPTAGPFQQVTDRYGEKGGE